MQRRLKNAPGAVGGVLPPRHRVVAAGASHSRKRGPLHIIDYNRSVKAHAATCARLKARDEKAQRDAKTLAEAVAEVERERTSRTRRKARGRYCGARATAWSARVRAALLIYGVFDFPAMLARARGDRSAEMMARGYLAGAYPAMLIDPRVSPLSAVRPGALPKSFIICGAADPLLPDSKAMGEALRSADIAHELHVLGEMPHGFLQMGMLSGCAEGLRLMFDFLGRTL